MKTHGILWSLWLIGICQTLSFGQSGPGLPQPLGDGPPCPPYCGFKTFTFQTNGRQLFDPCGTAVVLKGVNKQVYFDAGDPDGAISFREIAKTGANCVRIVWQMRQDVTLIKSSTARLDRIITNAKANKLIPIVGLWDYTTTPENDGGFSHLAEYVAYWTRADIVTLIRKHQTSLILNIANEAGLGDGCEDSPDCLNAYAAAYKTAVDSLRAKGINVPLMIDGTDLGKSLHCFAVKGQEILNADPRKNILFDFHPYWPKSVTDTLNRGQFIVNKFNEVRSLPITLVMGETAKYGAWAGNGVNPSSDAGEVDYSQLVRQADSAGIGWLLWEWGPGERDARGKLVYESMNMTLDRTYTSLNTIPTTSRRYWAKELAVDAPNSIKNTAQRTFFINHLFKTCPRTD